MPAVDIAIKQPETIGMSKQPIPTRATRGARGPQKMDDLVPKIGADGIDATEHLGDFLEEDFATGRAHALYTTDGRADALRRARAAPSAKVVHEDNGSAPVKK